MTTFFTVLSSSDFLFEELDAYFSNALKICCAQRSFGKPNMPEEIAGMATDARLYCSAFFKVEMTVCSNTSHSLKRP